MQHRVHRTPHRHSARAMLVAVAVGAIAIMLTGAPRAANAQLFSQADLITNPGGGAGGADLSAVQGSSLGLDSQGFFSSPGLFHNADNFSVTGGSWNISSFRFFGWLANSGTTSPFEFASWRVWDARPGDVGANVIAGDISVDALTSTGFTNIYRAPDAAPTSTQRPIMFIDAAANLALGPGDYWLEWVLDVPTGTAYVPPVTIPGVATTGNARQYNVIADAWTDVMDNNSPQGLPFQIFGSTTATEVPEPTSLALIATGLLMLTMRRRRYTRGAA